MNNKLYGNLIFELSRPGRRAYSLPKNRFAHHELPAGLRREQDAELPECDEITVVRHYTNHSENNFVVLNGFYPLGSCTMKYNPIINEEMAALPGFNNLHPLQPVETAQGALEVVYNLQHSLATLAGLHDFTLNPCAGAHGELTGLMIIRSYHQSRGDVKRTKVIVPDSAHGTNPASAAVCGLDIVEVKSTAEGLVDVEDLKPLLGDDIAAIMMTNPNTLGLFEKEIPEIAKLVHACGALLYYDGANFNPILGVARPGDMGFDVMHINLHKTFSTPHGGGGPGDGPVGVRKGLEQFLPKPHVVKDGWNRQPSFQQVLRFKLQQQCIEILSSASYPLYHLLQRISNPLPGIILFPQAFSFLLFFPFPLLSDKPCYGQIHFVFHACRLLFPHTVKA